MACFGVAIFLISLSLLLFSVSGQGASCDLYNNACVNGICELQANQQLECTCHPGFILDPINPLLCHPIPSCNLLQGTPDQQCLNGRCQQQVAGAFACMCYPGYQLSLTNPNICENVDECRLPYTGCAHGACIDVIGDYTCSACLRGYTLDQRGKCQQINVNPAPAPASQNSQHGQIMLPWLMDSMFF